MKTKNSLAVLGVVVLVVGGYFVYKNYVATPKPVAEVATGLNYINTNYGFQLNLPEDYRGYSVETYIDPADTKYARSAVFSFRLPIAKDAVKNLDWGDMFNLEVDKKSEYYKIPQELRDSGELDNSPGRYITENENYVFTWRSAQAVADDSLLKSYTEVPNIIKTFKFTK